MLMNSPFLRESDLLAKTLLHTVLVMMMLFVHIPSLIICKRYLYQLGQLAEIHLVPGAFA